MFTILQWNAQGMNSHGQELIQFLGNSRETFHVLCIQETWFHDENIMQIPNYTCFSKNRLSQIRGGCAIYVHNSLNFDNIYDKFTSETQMVDIILGKLTITIVNYYNPCKQISDVEIDSLINKVNDKTKTIIVGDFNSHNTIWGSDKTNTNGRLVENFVLQNDLVILNDGSGTRLDPHSGKTSCLDLSLVSSSLAGICSWKVLPTNFGSDHFPILIDMHVGAPHVPIAEPIDASTPRNFRNIDWNTYARLCEEHLNFSAKDKKNAIVFYDTFMALLTQILEKSKICKENKTKHTKPIPWWTKECSLSIKQRNKAKNKLLKSWSQETLESYRKKKAQAQRTLRQAKNLYWQSFCDNINRSTSVSAMWNFIKDSNGIRNNKRHVIPTLHVKENKVMDDNEKANEFAKFYQSFGKNNNENILNKQELPRVTPFQQETDKVFDNLVINESFQINELENVLKNKKPSTPGEDGIGYEVYKKLPDSKKKSLLELYNLIWETDAFPAPCKHSILIPIPKPGKDPHQLSAYRPIALTSCFMKIMESMVNERLKYFAEKHNILGNFQLGFRQGRGTVDNIVFLENDILKNLETGVKTLAIFVDLEKAYDALRVIKLLSLLQSLGLRGNILNFMKNFLLKRTFQVKIGQQKSDIFVAENGLPQGSILSPILFNLMVHDIPKCEIKKVHRLLYADDCVIWTSGIDTKEISSHIQSYLSKLNQWFASRGLKISHQKTTPILFSRGKKDDKFRLYLGDNELKVAHQYTYLGVVFDKRLTWRPHIEKVALRCKKKLNILKALAHSKFCQNISDIVRIYRSLIRSIMDYACEAYNSASASVKNILNSIQYEALRICAGSKQGTSLQTLQTEFGEMPLELRREMLSIRLRKRIESTPNHPLKGELVDCWQYELCITSNSRKPFGLRTRNLPHIIHQNIEFSNAPSNVPFWTWHPPHVSTELSLTISKQENAAALKQQSLEMIHLKWQNYFYIYTDGSKTPEEGRAAASFYVPEYKYKVGKRMNDNTSVYRAELAAIMLALIWVEQLPNLHTGVVIFSDSLSALQSIKSQKRDNMINEIMIQSTHLHFRGISVNLEWIPGHCDIAGNETADKAAKKATQNQYVDIENQLNKREFNSVLKSYFNEKWQIMWEESNAHLKLIQPNVCKTYKSLLNNRRLESVIHCLRMGNIGLNENLRKINRHESGLCDFCGSPETIEHFLCSCPKYLITRSMMIAEADIDEGNILSLLTSSDISKQKALVNYVSRSQRLFI